MSALASAFAMRELRCGQCGITFWAPEFYMAEKQKDGDTWYCPNGHPRVYRESDVEKLKKELAAEKQRAWAAEEKARLARIEANATAAELASVEKREKRLKKRIANGVCPCCHRSFLNVQRHMKTKHPGYEGQTA